MTKLDQFSKTLVVIAAAVAGACTPLIFDLLQPSASKGVASIIVFILLLFGLFLFQMVIENIAAHSARVRRLILGRCFVEGYWCDTSRDASGNLIGAACIFIYQDDGKIKISGTTLKANDGMYASWDVKFASLRERTLSYAFESHTSSATSVVELGYAELKFSHGAGLPTSYSGFFFDTTHKELITLEGFRVSDRDKISKLDDPLARREFLRRFYEEAPNVAEPPTETEQAEQSGAGNVAPLRA
jgi:hypothetical protein